MQAFCGSALYEPEAAAHIKSYLSTLGLELPGVYESGNILADLSGINGLDIEHIRLQLTEAEDEDFEDYEAEDFSEDKLVSDYNSTYEFAAAEEKIPLDDLCEHVNHYEDMVEPPVVVSEVKKTSTDNHERDFEPGTVTIGKPYKFQPKDVFSIPYGDNVVRIIDYDGAFSCEKCHDRSSKVLVEYYRLIVKHGTAIPLADVARITQVTLKTLRMKEKAMLANNRAAKFMCSLYVIVTGNDTKNVIHEATKKRKKGRYRKKKPSDTYNT